MQTLSPILNLSYIYFRTVLLHRMVKSSELLIIFGINSTEHSFWKSEL